MCTGGINRLFTRSFIYFPCRTLKVDHSGCPFAFHVGQSYVVPVMVNFQIVIFIGHPDCIIAICLTEVEITTDYNRTTIQIHVLSCSSVPAIWRSCSEYQIVSCFQSSAADVQFCTFAVRPKRWYIRSEGHAVTDIKCTTV